MRGTVALLLVALLSARAAGDAPKPPPRDPPFGWSIATGLTLALVPLAVGGGLLATGDHHEVELNRGALGAIACGLAVAPIVSHLMVREWKRAAIFGAVPVAAGAVVLGMTEGSSVLRTNGTLDQRIVLGAALAVELLAAGVGIIDSLLARERARVPFAVLPAVGRHHVGLAIGGTL